MGKKRVTDDMREQPKRRRTATTAEEREDQVINLAIDLAEKQLANGTATSQIMVHYLRLGTVKSKLEIEKIRHENELLQAKTAQIKSVEKLTELYEDAISAMRSYQGVSPGDEEPVDD